MNDKHKVGEQMLVLEEPMPCPEPGCSGTLRRLYARHGWFYGCDKYRETRCKGSVSCHPDGSPAAIPADSRTKVMRQIAHLFFDRLWQRWPMSRDDAYELMRQRMGFEQVLHIGHLNEEQCERLIELVQSRIDELKAQSIQSRFEEVEVERVELEGPFECSSCGGHLMVDVSYLNEVSYKITCPYCQNVGDVKVP